MSAVPGVSRLVVVLCLTIVLTSTAAILQPGDIVFADSGIDKIIRLDRTTGLTNHVATVDFPDATGGIAVGYNGDIYAMRAKLGFDPYAEFFRVDGQTGAVTPLSAETLIQTGRRMKLSPDGLSLVVAGEDQNGGRGVYRVDIATGHQSIITTNLTNGPDYERPWDVAFSPQGHIYVTDYNWSNLLRFDADGSNRQKISEDGLFRFIGGIDVAADGYIYVADRNNHGVIRVDPSTGAQSQTTTNNLLRNPSDICVDLDGSLLVADAVADVLIRVNPTNGLQTLLHSGTPGPRSPCVFVPRASLLYQRTSTGHLTLRWPDHNDFWQLQCTPTPAVTNSWTNSALVPALSGDERKVSATPDTEMLFFRLRKH